ncbi:MAG: hypothetical protein P8Y53_11580 [Pseudolabrys sp.]
MDQETVAGIGNIFSDEILFQARINPAEGRLRPERHKGGRCPHCRSPLKVFKVGARTAYCCPKCQAC